MLMISIDRYQDLHIDRYLIILLGQIVGIVSEFAQQICPVSSLAECGDCAGRAGWSRPWAMFVEIEDREEEERGDPGHFQLNYGGK